MSEGRVAIVTGAGRGIGRGIAIALGQRGWRVVVNYRGSAAAATETAEAIADSGGDALVVQADVAVTEDRRRLVAETVKQWGGIDLLVNNAGITSPDRDKDLLDHSEEAFDQVIGTNLKGPYFLTQLVAREMIDRPADANSPPRAVVNVGSLSSYAVSTNRGDYCLAKSALSMMTQVWAARLAEHRINVYEVRPGIIASDMTAPVKAKYDKLIAEGLLPIARWGEAQDVAKAVVTLAGGALAYSTGEVINVDGGYHIRRL